MIPVLRDQITVLRAPTVGGPYGGTEPDWGNAVSTVYPADVQPNNSTEDVVNQQRTETRWRVWLPANADVVATDRVLWDGDTYEVDGHPKRWKVRAVPHHTELVLTRVSGG